MARNGPGPAGISQMPLPKRSGSRTAFPQRQRRTCNPLWHSPHHPQICRSAQSQCPSLKTKTVNPHTIRHTTAMHLLRAGNDVNMVSYWLGHADINTTHIYVEIDMDMKRKMLPKAAAPFVNKALPWQKPEVLQWLAKIAKSPQLCVEKR